MEDVLTEASTDMMLASASAGAIAAWDDSKKIAFVQTYKDRTACARYILERVAAGVMEIALRRKFIGMRHIRQVYGEDHITFSAREFVSLSEEDKQGYHNWDRYKIGGREQKDLLEIAQERAKEVIEGLPPLRKALAVIDPDSAQMLDKIEQLEKGGEKIRAELEVVCEPIIMAELPETMTIGEFRRKISQLDKERIRLLKKLDDIGKEGSDLEAIVAKKLYRGIPGLAEAVVEVAKSFIERSKALDGLGRRVEEQVRFGDSAEAVELLRTFEKDEAKISSNIKAKFDAALEALKVASQKKPTAKARAMKGTKA